MWGAGQGPGLGVELQEAEHLLDGGRFRQEHLLQTGERVAGRCDVAGRFAPAAPIGC